jgi:small-conductance mechanosensitive channel
MWHLAPDLLQPMVAGLAVTAGALVLRALLSRRLARAAAAAGPGAQESLGWGTGIASLLWCFVVGAWAALEAADLAPRHAQRLEMLLQALVIATTTITAAGLLASGSARVARRHGLTVALTGLSQAVIRTGVLLVGGLVLLGHLGVAISPLLTAVGIGGLATALALQDTLSNVFGGVHLLADKPIRVGDLIRLENGMEGVVEDIGWRSTRIRGVTQDLIIVPNAKLAQSIVTNCRSRSASVRQRDPHRMERPG